MKKQIIDCNYAIGHPKHTQIVDMEPAEIQKALEASAIAEAKALEPKPLTQEERLAELEAKLAILEGAK